MPAKEFPLISEELLKALDEVYPEKCPNPSATDREIWRAVGNREVVRFLAKKREQQIDTKPTNAHVYKHA